ncbi:hypothetical protein B0H63DRAFT_434251 [Podospora didyma]|uniref:Heme haloperoxidase family profile domain-containing protein n=1 Tax=Podospora didyma TaxID=330526 RepID=A0AAE0TV57_9PEZI|nr:hypothetical protein B0H63DRAFT_434251 [Podospora didyma]
MHLKLGLLAAAAAAAAGVASAQRPTATSICDYYTTALLKNNTAENQLTLLTLLVNTVVIGNYTMPNVGVIVPGILAAGVFNGNKVDLLPYFTGDLLSTNRGGSKGVSVNFLDGGGAAPLRKNMPADDPTSNQYFLLTHLYQFFGALLGCSQYGMGGAFAAYSGDASMYETHKFMDLDADEVGYFVEQIALAAASFGVAKEDITAVGTALNSLFGLRCAPPTTVIPAQGDQLQAICIADDCPLSPNATCDKYESAFPPASAVSTSTTMTGTTMMGGSTGTSMTGTMNPTGMPSTTTGSGSMPTSSVVTAGAPAATRLSLVAVVGGFAALLF